jgi:hypothetical protein
MGRWLGMLEIVRILKEADSSYNHHICLEGVEPGTFLLTNYLARTLTTAFGYIGLRISFFSGVEVYMIGKCVEDLYSFCQEQVG